MISLKSKVAQAVLGYFMLHESSELYMNEMARRLSLDDGNLTRKLKELEQEGILKSEERGKERFYSVNKAFPLLKEYKQIILKTIGFERELKEYLKRVKGLKQVYIFGSYAQDRMDTASDIDLLVIGDHNAVELQMEIAALQKRINREVNVKNLTSTEFDKKKKTDPLLKDILQKKKIRVL